MACHGVEPCQSFLPAECDAQFNSPCTAYVGPAWCSVPTAGLLLLCATRLRRVASRTKSSNTTTPYLDKKCFNDSAKKWRQPTYIQVDVLFWYPVFDQDLAGTSPHIARWGVLILPARSAARTKLPHPTGLPKVPFPYRLFGVAGVGVLRVTRHSTNIPNETKYIETDA